MQHSINMQTSDINLSLGWQYKVRLILEDLESAIAVGIPECQPTLKPKAGVVHPLAIYIT